MAGEMLPNLARGVPAIKYRGIILAAADYTEYADGVRLYGSLPREEAMELSLYLVEGDCPGNDFCGVYFDGDLVELNAGLACYGINVIVA